MKLLKDCLKPIKHMVRDNRGQEMGKVWYSSDLHLDHKNIGRFRDYPEHILEQANQLIESGKDTRPLGTIANEIWIKAEWHSAGITDRDTVHLLGDNSFGRNGLLVLADLPGRKISYGGNHDDLNITDYLMAFSDYRGCVKKPRVGWLSHFPLHPTELRGHFSIHGHVHYATIPDYRFVNVCCDNLYKETGSAFIEQSDLKELIDRRRESKKVEY